MTASRYSVSLWCPNNVLKLMVLMVAQLCEYTKNQRIAYFKRVNVCYVNYTSLSSLISFIGILQFSEYRFFTSLGRFIPRYFIHFDVIVNEILSLISLSVLFLLVYRNARDFCELILYLQPDQIHL